MASYFILIDSQGTEITIDPVTQALLVELVAAGPGVVIGTVNVEPQTGLAAHVHEPAANTAAVVTLPAAGAGVRNVLGLIAFSYDGLPAVPGNLMVEDGVGTTTFSVDIPESGPGPIPFNPGLAGTANTAMVITLSAGGAGITGKLSVHAWTE